MKSVTPKFITKEICDRATKLALGMIMGLDSTIRSLIRHPKCHIVVLVPEMDDDRETNYAEWPVYPVRPHCLFEYSLGKEDGWPDEYDSIARCKALQLWTGRNDDRTMPIPHLLFPGDTPFWGGVKRRGIVVTCSGVQPWFDKMISGVIADLIVGLAHDAFINDDEVKNYAAFLS